jgi:acetylornithine deacetylase/succinyl-diaminopimelate desuccinylase-like protein
LPLGRRYSPFFALTLVLSFFAACAPGRKAELQQPVLDITAFQKNVIAKLSGQEEIRPGLKLANRAAAENKQAARLFLEETWRSLGLAVLKQDYSPEGENVYTILKATAPSEEYVIFGAHYDTSRNSPGANDDATGVALVTAAAVELSRTRPRLRNFIFVLFDEEERGMRGSRAFAQKLKDEGLKVHSVHTVDQMGWDKDLDQAIELELPYPGAVDLYQAAAKTLSPPIPILVTQETGSDHSAFRRLGFQAVGITEEYRNKDTTPHIHKPTDTFETIQFDYLKSTTGLVFTVLKTLARKEE